MKQHLFFTILLILGFLTNGAETQASENFKEDPDLTLSTGVNSSTLVNLHLSDDENESLLSRSIYYPQNHRSAEYLYTQYNENDFNEETGRYYTATPSETDSDSEDTSSEESVFLNNPFRNPDAAPKRIVQRDFQLDEDDLEENDCQKGYGHFFKNCCSPYSVVFGTGTIIITGFTFKIMFQFL